MNLAAPVDLHLIESRHATGAEIPSMIVRNPRRRHITLESAPSRWLGWPVRPLAFHAANNYAQHLGKAFHIESEAGRTAVPDGRRRFPYDLGRLGSGQA